MPACCRREADARARAITWMFAAIGTVEPPIVERSIAILFERDQPWYEERLPIVQDPVRAAWTTSPPGSARPIGSMAGSAPGDLLMVSVLRRLASSGILDDYPNLAAYVARAEARPAYQRAFGAQLAVFTANQA